jgi:hypothetical protein
MPPSGQSVELFEVKKVESKLFSPAGKVLTLTNFKLLNFQFGGKNILPQNQPPHIGAGRYFMTFFPYIGNLYMQDMGDKFGYLLSN